MIRFRFEQVVGWRFTLFGLVREARYAHFERMEKDQRVPRYCQRVPRGSVQE